MRRGRWGIVAASLLLGALAHGCASPTPTDEEIAQGATQASTAHDGFVYFHGMAHLGFSREALRGGLGTQSLLAPSFSDAQLQAEPASNILAYLATKSDAVVAGYSLGRVSVLRLMAANAPGMERAVLVDPTYDSAAGLGSGIGGGVAKAWLDGGQERSLLLVYGDVTRSLGGEKSYARELATHPRATLCYVRGDHERFRHADMVAALVATDCADLNSRLLAQE
jgi:hypothetical protein